MSAQTYVPQVLADLESRSLGSSADRERWLEARRGVVTATEAKVFLAGTAREKNKIIEEKVSGVQSFHGNQYTEWGNLREPHIIAQLAGSGYSECGVLYHAQENSRHAATPDAILVTWDDDIHLAEIKTSKHDLTPGPIDEDGYLLDVDQDSYFARSGYLSQMAWQFYCCGATEIEFVWEQHNDDWSGWDEHDRKTWRMETGPKPFPIQRVRIRRSFVEPLIAKLIKAADRWLVKLDEALAQAQQTPEKPFSPVLDALAVDVIRGRQIEAEGKAKKDPAWKALLAQLDEIGEDYQQESSSARITYTAPYEEEVEVVEQDIEAARAAAPEVWERLQRSTEESKAAAIAWAEVLKEHTTTRTETQIVKPRSPLTVTAVKKGSEE
ncbi:YqaJ viral recombinase family protein [Microbacterium sp. XT11]|uniref:YqaJ viral recombinase family protein n=1 Tax=Microbacterium sp. XT11 TaxID=367477 RepID=UPI00082CE318|nr:YqaJ viral recombinase family protein [Microbacterium sp. XT11]